MAYIEYNGPDIVSGTLLKKLHETTLRYTALDMKLAAADGDRSAALQSWIDSTDNVQAVKLRQQIETATAKLNELADKNVETVVLTEDDKAKIAVEQEELKAAIKAAYTVMDTLITGMSDDKEGVRKALESIENPVKSKRGRAAGSTGSNLPRISANVTLTGGNFKEPQVYDSFSKVATALNAEVKDIQLAFAKAAGVEHQQISTVTKPVTFKFQANENGAVYTLVTKPKERAPRGSKQAAKSEEKPAESTSSTGESAESTEPAPQSGETPAA